MPIAGTTRPGPHRRATCSNGAGSARTRRCPSRAPTTASSSRRARSATPAGCASTAPATIPTRRRPGHRSHGRGLMRITHKVDYAVRAMTALARHRGHRTGPARQARGTRHRAGHPAGVPRRHPPQPAQRRPRRQPARRRRRLAPGPAGGRDQRGRDHPRGRRTAGRRAGHPPPRARRRRRARTRWCSLWVATRVALRSVLDEVTVAHLAAGKLPPKVAKLLDSDDAWSAR